MNKPKSIKGLKQFITKCINEEPNGNYCWYNFWPKLTITKELIDNLQKYVDKKRIQYFFIINNVEEARPQRSATEPEFYRPTSLAHYFSKCCDWNNSFIIAFWGNNWVEDNPWDLNKILEGMKDFPDYSSIILLKASKSLEEVDNNA